MKKLAILTSLLALTACGGGSGGGAGTPADVLTAQQHAAATSNAKITGMKSFIVVGGNNPTVNSNARIATTLNDGGKIYDLSDVTFYSADKEFSSDIDEDLRLQLITDVETGKITALKVVDDKEYEEIQRDGEGNKFGRSEENDEQDGFDFATLNLLGEKQGLQYSDFGYIEIYHTSDSVNPMFIMPIAGGYNIKNITDKMDKNNFAQNVVFKGVAVGNVGEPDTTVEGARLLLRDNNAVLTFDATDGKEILSANFIGYKDTEKNITYSDWYNVVATKYNTGADAGKAEIAFIAPEGRNIPVGFKATNSGKVENNSADNKLSVGFEYYGDSEVKPAEATGIIFYQHEDEQPFLMGFGAKKD